MRVPAIIAASIICFALGVGAGILSVQILNAYGINIIEQKPGTVAQESAPGMGGQGGGGPGGLMMPPGGTMPMMGQGGGPPASGPQRGSQGTGAKTQLASLVAKLDQLTQKPLAVNLTDEQKKKVREQLQGLGDQDDLSDDDAKKRLDALMEVVTPEQKETLEAAGARLPGRQIPIPRPADAPKNPFKEEANAKHLKSLQDQLEAKRG